MDPSSPQETIALLRAELAREKQFSASLLRSLETMTTLFADIVERKRKRDSALNK